MSTTTEPRLGQPGVCRVRPSCGARVYNNVTLTGLRRDGAGNEVSVGAEPVTEVHDHTKGLIAVFRDKDALVGRRVTVHQARGMLAPGLVHREHTCGE